MKKIIYFGITVITIYFAWNYFNKKDKPVEDDLIIDVTPDDQPRSNNWTSLAEPTISFINKNNKPSTSVARDTTQAKGKAPEVFTEKIKNLNQVIEACRSNLSQLLPKEFIENYESEFKNPEDIISTLDRFYEITGPKFKAMKEVNDLLIDYAGVELTSDFIFQNMQNVKDCGEFEEHSLMSIVLENSFEQDWSADMKKKILNTVFDNYIKTLNQPIELIHLNVKIGSLYEFVNNDLLPSKYKADIQELLRMVTSSQDVLRSFLPEEYSPDEKISAEATKNLKEREVEEVENLKSVFREFLIKVKDELPSQKMAP